MSNLTHPVRRLRHTSSTYFIELLAECRSPLWTDESQVENYLQFGKVQNLRKACQKLHLLEIPANETFCFWKQVGRVNASAGYAQGRELRQGCLIPSIGGGLCQLSNSLYDLALQTGCEIIERHAHSAVVPGSAAEKGRDATVFWNYVDLRFRPKQSTLITAVLTRNELVVRFWGKQRLVSIAGQEVEILTNSTSINTCTDCEASECFRHVPLNTRRTSGRTAFMVEECWPEFEEFANETRSQEDDLFLPYHSTLKSIARYKWNNDGYRRTNAANVQTLFAAGKSRLRLDRGKPPIAVQVARSQALASYYSSRLSIDTTHLYVAQSLLPFLWRNGDLGGRTFSVLMTRSPLRTLHQQLDELAAKFPERKTLREFRAPDWMAQAEAEALEQAEQIITPHSWIPRFFLFKTRLLEWKMPDQIKAVERGMHVVFPGPSVARKGAFEVRRAVQDLDCPLCVLDGTLESEGFWDSVQLVSAPDDWLNNAAVIVQPTYIENNPRLLLRGLAAGIPVIATDQCGIAQHPLLTLVPAGDVEALRNAIKNVISANIHSQFTEDHRRDFTFVKSNQL